MPRYLRLVILLEAVIATPIGAVIAFRQSLALNRAGGAGPLLDAEFTYLPRRPL